MCEITVVHSLVVYEKMYTHTIIAILIIYDCDPNIHSHSIHSKCNGKPGRLFTFFFFFFN